MSGTSVDLRFTTLQSSQPPAQQAFSDEAVLQLFQHAVEAGGVWADGQPALVQVVSDQPGQSFSLAMAPQLAQPSLDGESLTVDSALALVAHLQTTIFQLNLVSNAMRAQIDSLTQEINLQQQRDDNLAAMDARIRVQQAAEAGDVTGGISLGASIAGAVIAVVLAAIFSGGLALAVAGVAVTMALLEVGSKISQAAGAKVTGLNGQQRGLDFTVAGLTQMAIESQVTTGQIVIAEQRPDGSWVDANGKPIAAPTVPPGMVMTPQAFNDYYTYTGMAISLALGVAMMAGGFAAAKIGVDVARLGANVARLNGLLGTAMTTRYVQQVGAIAETASSVVEGATNVVNGGVQVDLAVKKNELEKLNIALEHLKAQIDFLSQHMHLMQEIVNRMMEQHNASMVSVIQSIGKYYQGQTLIAQNVVHNA